MKPKSENRIIFIAFLILLISCLSACNPKDDVSEALDLAGDNRIELLRVLDYYRENNDSLKLKAALF